jgi:hypothetical protein
MLIFTQESFIKQLEFQKICLQFYLLLQGVQDGCLNGVKWWVNKIINSVDQDNYMLDKYKDLLKINKIENKTKIHELKKFLNFVNWQVLWNYDFF